MQLACENWKNDVDWLVGFYGISTFVGYITPSSDYMNEYLVGKILCGQDFICSHMIHHHHHHRIVRLARISLTFFLHVSLSFIASGRSSGLHPVSSHSCCMYVRAGRPAFDWPYAGVHRSTSLTSSSLLLQQWPACLEPCLSQEGQRKNK